MNRIKSTEELKRILNAPYFHKEECEENEERIRRLKSMMVYAAPTTSSIGKGGDSDPHKLEKLETKLEDLQISHQKKLLSYLKQIELVKKIIERMDRVQLRRILEKRYLDHKKWCDIAEEMNYSEQHVQRLHKQALDVLVVLLNSR